MDFCAQEESRLMTRDHQEEDVQYFSTRFKKKGKKNFGPQHEKSERGSSSSQRKKDLSKSDVMDVRNLDTSRDIFLICLITRRERGKNMLLQQMLNMIT